MKITSKITSVFFAFILLLSFATATLAAGTEIGGNLRVWWKANDDTNGFFFDQLDLTFKSALTENNGFKGEIRYFQVDKNNQTSGDIRVYNAYYYQTNIWTKDELNVGYFNAPFDYDKFISLVLTPSYNYVWTKQELGIKYGFATDHFQVIAALANLDNQKNNNGGFRGYDFSFRGIYTPVKNLSFGFGYTRDNISNITDTYNDNFVYDVVYSNGNFGVFAEYTQKRPNNGEEKNGVYIEGTYKFADKLTAYAGASISIDDFSTSSTTVYNNIFVGAKYQLATKTALQTELVQFDDEDNTWNLNVRLRVDF